jgi:hypothetical protein
MSQNSYNNIKRYAAFVFMVFTVLSGSSEVADSDNFVKVGRKAFIDILSTSRLSLQDTRISTSQLRSRSAIEVNKDFREFLDTYAGDTHLSNVQVYVFPLIVFTFCISSVISQNNIWKSAVF